MKGNLHIFMSVLTVVSSQSKAHLSEEVNRLIMEGTTGMSRNHSAGRTNYVSPGVQQKAGNLSLAGK